MNLYEITVWPIGHPTGIKFENQESDTVARVVSALSKAQAFTLHKHDNPYRVFYFAAGQVPYAEYEQTGGTE